MKGDAIRLVEQLALEKAASLGVESAESNAGRAPTPTQLIDAVLAEHPELRKAYEYEITAQGRQQVERNVLRKTRDAINSIEDEKAEKPDRLPNIESPIARSVRIAENVTVPGHEAGPAEHVSHHRYQRDRGTRKAAYHERRADQHVTERERLEELGLDTNLNYGKLDEMVAELEAITGDSTDEDSTEK